MVTEPESHSHRSDQEWRALVRSWRDRLHEIELNTDEAWIRGFDEILDGDGEGKQMNARLKSVFIFPNRMVVVFDTNNEQVADLQGVWEKVKDRLLPLIEKDKPEIKDALGVLS